MGNSSRQFVTGSILTIFLAFCHMPSSAQLIVRAGGSPGIVSRIVSVDDDVWVVGLKGVYRVNRKTNQAVSLANDALMVYSLTPVGKEIWIGTMLGGFSIDRKANRAVPLTGDAARANDIISVGDEAWITGISDVFHVDLKTNHTERINGDGDSFWGHRLILAGDEIWLTGLKGASKVDRKTNRAVPIAGDFGSVSAIASIDHDTWIGSEKGVFRVDRDTNLGSRLAIDTGWVHSIFLSGDDVWISALNGFFHVSKKTNDTEKIAGLDYMIIGCIAPFGEEIWVGGNDVFRVDKRKNQAIPLNWSIGAVTSIVAVDDELWFGTSNGAFRMDPKSRLTVDLAGSLPMISRFFGVPVWFEGDSYPVVHSAGRRGEDWYDASEADPMVIDAPDKAGLEKKLKDPTNWLKATEQGTNIRLKPGRITLYFSIHDKYGNTSGLEPLKIEGWVLPTWTLSFLIPFIAVSFCGLCLTLAPWVRYCHMLLMNPFVRNWASFGTVPLLLTTVPPVRKHIFRRYLRTMAGAEKFKTMGTKYIVPDTRFNLVSFGETLSRAPVICLHGQSGVGKSAFLAYLASECSSMVLHEPLLRRLTPVFVDLSIVGDQNPESMVKAELRKNGDLTDEKIVDALLDYGGFLFLFDGLNEVSEVSQTGILQFADVHRNHSFTCISTQIVTDELLHISKLISVDPLSPDKILELIRRKSIDLETGRQLFDSELLIEEMTPACFAISNVPFQLELLIEVWEALQQAPQGIDELYSYALGSIIDKEAWIKKGHGDYPDILCELAFTLLTERRPFDPKKDNLPDEIKWELKARRLFNDRAGVMEFRHDRVRAYLAARHFSLRWRSILVDESTVIDSNWDPMMEFYLEREQDTIRAKEMMLLLASKDPDATIRITQWGRTHHPELFTGWLDQLAHEFGKKVLFD